MSDTDPAQRPLRLTWGENERDGAVHVEWHAPCGCAYHPEGRYGPHVHPCPQHIDPGVERIADERRRQVDEEGWTAEHDDQHRRGELAAAAACYALHCVDTSDGEFLADVFDWFWPFEPEWWRPGAEEDVSSCVRRLEKAGALIAAEIDRLLRDRSASTE